MKLKLCFLSGAMLFSISSYAQYQEIHTKHFFKGYPAGTPASNDLIIRDLYALSNNDNTKFADWVAYRIDSVSMSGQSMPRDWKPDPWLADDETLEPNDYRGAYNALNTDRGHQAPLGSLDGGSDYFETNYLSNITPQKSALNRGPWVKIEDSEREIISHHKLSDYIIVYTGPLYEREMPEMPGADEDATVPSGFWKIIIVPTSNGFETASFIFDQDTPRNAIPTNFLVTIDEIESRSGLDFFWELKPAEQNMLEQSDNSTWAKQYF